MTNAAPRAEFDGPEILLLQCLELPPAARRDCLEGLCRAHPEHAAPLRRLFERLDAFGLVDEPDPEAPTPPTATNAPERLGNYLLFEPIGHGGMGSVHLAVQEPLGRRVALKLIHAGSAASTRARERFRREVQAISLLDHPHICPVYDAGEVDGVPYLAMRFVDGPTLAHDIERRRRARASTPGSRHASTASELDAIVLLGEQLAEALHAAHERGIVHRDVKPGNVLLDGASGAPLLVDFGLAQLDRDDAPTLTLSGDRLGTPAYMAPEQITGRRVDRRADVYALGATLYEAVTLRLPHEATTREALYRRILAGDVASARLASPAVSRDLDVVLLTALDRDPERRYATALAFAQDLRRARLGQPIEAKPPGLARQTAQAVQRHPVVATAASLLFAGVTVALLLLQQRTEALVKEAAARRTAEANAQALRANELAQGDPTAALHLALAAVELEENVETRSALYGIVVQHHERRRLGVPGVYCGCAQFSPDGTMIVAGIGTGAQVFDLNGQPIGGRVEHENTVYGVSWHPSGTCFVTAGGDGHAFVCWLDGRKVALPHPDPFGRGNPASLDDWYDAVAGNSDRHMLWSAAFSPDGQRVATASTDHHARVFDARTGTLLSAMRHKGPVYAMAWSADGHVASAVGFSGIAGDPERCEILVWKPALPEGEILHRFAVADQTHTLQFSPDGTHLVAASATAGCNVYRMHDGAVVNLVRDGTSAVARFTHAGDTVLSATLDGTVRRQRLDGSLLSLVRQPGSTDTRSGIGKVGPSLYAVSGFDMAAHVYDESLLLRLSLRGSKNVIWTIDGTEQGHIALTTSDDGLIRLWQLFDAALPCLYHPAQVVDLFEGPPGHVWTVCRDQVLRRWRLATGDVDTTRTVATPPWRAMRTRDGAVAVITQATSQLSLLPLDHDDAPLRSATVHGCNQTAELRDGRILVGSMAGELRWLSARDGTSGHFAVVDRGMLSIDTSLFDLISVGTRSGHISLYDADGRRVRRWHAHEAGIHALRFHPDGHSLASGDENGSVRIWNLRAPECTELLGHTSAIFDLDWSTDGTLLATGSGDGTARLWRSEDGTPHAVLRVHAGGNVGSVLFSSDGRWLWTAGDDGRVQAWPTSFAELRTTAQKRAEALALTSSGVSHKARLAALGRALHFGTAGEARALADALLVHAEERASGSLAQDVAHALSRWSEPLVLRDADLALRAAELARSLSDPPGATLLTLLAHIRFERGEFVLAVDLLEQAVAKEPTPERQQKLARYRARLAAADRGRDMGR